MKFLIRVDDIGMRPEEAPIPPGKKWDHGLKMAMEFDDALDGLPWMAACVPMLCDEDGIARIRSRHNITVALHGWDHCEVMGARNEFEGLSVDACREKIDKSQKHIGPTKFFVPPWNAYTSNFVEAAWHEGIRHVFVAPEEWPTPPSPVNMGKGVKFWPAWFPLYGALGWRQSNESCDRILSTIPSLLDHPGRAVLTLHITWEAARDPKFKHVQDLAKMIKDHIVTAEEFVK